MENFTQKMARVTKNLNTLAGYDAPESDVLVIERIFNAEPGRVFAAFASAEALSQWFGPEGCDVLEAEVDFRVGGRYRLRIDTTDGGEIDLVGGYREIAKPDKLAFTWRWEGNPNFNPCDSLVELIFSQHESGTLLKLVQTGIGDGEDLASHEWGWGSTFNKLEKLFIS